MGPCDMGPCLDQTNLVELERCVGGPTGAATGPGISATATVAATSLDEQTTREENGVGGPEFFTQVH